MKHIFLGFYLITFLCAAGLWNEAEASTLEQEVQIQTPDTAVVLAGTLLVPEGDFSGTVVLFITGSGDHVRDQVISGTPMFKILAERLADAGIASLRLDDRGTGASTGPTAMQSTTADRVEDMRAAMAWLRSTDKPPFTRVGLMGHSEGAAIAIQMAAKEETPDFVVLLAAPTLPGKEVWLSQQFKGLQNGSFDEATIHSSQECLRQAVKLSVGNATPTEMTANTERLFELIGIDPATDEGKESVEGFISFMCNPWMRYYLSYDPTPDLQRLALPTLAIYGSHDEHTLPAINAPALLSGMFQAQNTQFTLKVLPEQDHFFLRKPGEPVGVHVYEQMVLSDDLCQTVTSWINRL